jgi:hypothetical protein
MRTSRATLQRACADLQAEVEARIMEGFFARIRRYFDDRILRKKLILMKAATKEVNS